MSDFVATLLLIVFPVLWVTRPWSSEQWPVVRVLGVSVALLAGGAHFPTIGATWEELRRAILLVSASIVFLLVLRASDPRRQDRWRIWLWGTAISALIVYLNFFRLHGPGVSFVHPHEFAHYYLGSKYAAELDYPDIYAALLRAEADDQDGQVVAHEARDLVVDRVVPVNALAALGAAIKERFTSERWREFRADAAYFRHRPGLDYRGVLIDHGYNASPLWSLIGGSLANATVASDETLRRLSLLDVVILGAVGAAIAGVLGGDAAALALIYFCVAFGSELGWVGGGYLRQMWFAGVVGFVLCLSKGRYGWAGALLAGSATLRVFPGFFAFGLLARVIGDRLESRPLDPRHRRFFVAFLGTAALLVLATAVYPGLDRWQGFFANTSRHAGRVGFNAIGLLQSSAWLFAGDLPELPGAWLEQMGRWRQAFTGFHTYAVFLPALVAAFFVARRLDDVRAAAIGAPLLLCGLNLAGYYYTLVVAVVLAFRDRADKLAWLFAAELAVHVLQLFESANHTLHLYKGLVLLGAFVAVYWPEDRRSAEDGAG